MEETRTGRKARIGSLKEIGAQIERWLREARASGPAGGRGTVRAAARSSSAALVRLRCSRPPPSATIRVELGSDGGLVVVDREGNLPDVVTLGL